MAAIIPFPGSLHRTFDPETCNVLSAAFEDAWSIIVRSGSTFASPGNERATREIVARRIVDLAQSGERDRCRLRDGAVEPWAYLARQLTSDESI